MKVENYSYETFPEFDEYVDGMVELNGVKDNLRVRLLDVNYQDDCIIRFLFPNTILDDKRKYPLIIHVQGSGWYKQDMNDHIFDYMPIVKHGYVIALIEHHPSPKYKFPTQLNDVKIAIRYIKNHYDEYPIDINNVYLSGDSSGGHLALMTLFTYEEDLLPLSGMIDYYGLTDFTTFYDDGYSKYDETDFTNIYDLLGEYKEDNLELYKEASPIYHIHENMKLPPILILHGSKDHVVPFEQSVKLYYKLMENHYNVTLCKVNHADHGRSIFYVKEVYDYIIKFLNRYKKDSFDKSFFDQRLKKEEVNIEECIKLLLDFNVSEKTIIEGLYNQFCIDEKNALRYVEKVKLRRYLENPLNRHDYYTNEDNKALAIMVNSIIDKNRYNYDDSDIEAIVNMILGYK